MYNGIVQNKLSNEDIKKLILDGKLNEMLIDKFIKKLTKMNNVNKESTTVVEGFCGDTSYAPF